MQKHNYFHKHYTFFFIKIFFSNKNDEAEINQNVFKNIPHADTESIENVFILVCVF